MAATSGKQYSVGFRSGRVYELDSRGLIAATTTTVYEGVRIPSVKSLALTIPDIRRIAHVGDDRLKAQDSLPRIEPSSGVLTVGRNDYDLYALITNTVERTIGEAKKIGYATDKQGTEIDLGMLTFQQSLDYAARTRRYRGVLFPILHLAPVPGNLDENPTEFTYNLTPLISDKALWGEQYDETADGYVEAEFDDMMFVNYPHICAWLGDNIVTKFTFHASRQAISVDKIHGVWIAAAAANYAIEDATVALAVDGVTPTAKPAAGDLVICMYEYAATNAE